MLVVGCAACSPSGPDVRASRSDDFASPTSSTQPQPPESLVTIPGLILPTTVPRLPATTTTVPAADPGNQRPIAAFTNSCAGLGCAFDASGSSDFEGQIASFAWDFGDGTTATGETIFHSYAVAGTYTVLLTITDGTNPDTMTHDVSVAPIVETISFVGQASVSAQSGTHVANVPASVEPGDGLLLFFSSGTDATIFEPTGVSGWVPLDTVIGVNGATRAWRKVAAEGDAGAQVSVGASLLTKGHIAILAYRGTAADDPVADFARDLSTDDSAARTTPNATVDGPTWAVSYWMHRDSSTTALTPPDAVTVRASGTQDGGGRVTVLVADSAASVPAGFYGELTATADAASSLATVWTIVLAPL